MFGMSKPAKGSPAKKEAAKPAKKALVSVTLKMSAAQRDKLAQLGGSEWVQERIDEARPGANPFG